MNTVYGNIHSVETFGTVDGPGIRTVIFMQGCPMRCKYCHNPDTWLISDNKKMSVDEILNKYDSIKEFLKNGGITVSGGEPLLQIDFVIELFKKAKEKNKSKNTKDEMTLDLDKEIIIGIKTLPKEAPRKNKKKQISKKKEKID